MRFGKGKGSRGFGQIKGKFLSLNKPIVWSGKVLDVWKPSVCHQLNFFVSSGSREVWGMGEVWEGIPQIILLSISQKAFHILKKKKRNNPLPPKQKQRQKNPPPCHQNREKNNCSWFLSLHSHSPSSPWSSIAGLAGSFVFATLQPHSVRISPDLCRVSPSHSRRSQWPSCLWI